MADKKLSEVTKVTDMAYVPVILSDGSVGQIAKADLATVVAGQKPFFNLFGVRTTLGLNSLNDITENSIIYASKSHNLNDMPYDYCMVLTFINGEYGMQIAVSVDQNRMAYRGRVRGDWNPWVGL